MSNKKFVCILFCVLMVVNHMCIHAAKPSEAFPDNTVYSNTYYFHMSCLNSNGYDYQIWYAFSSDSEPVIYFDSSGELIIYCYSNSSYTFNRYLAENDKMYSNEGPYNYTSRNIMRASQISGCYNFSIDYSDMKIFSDYNSADSYLTSGSLEGLLYENIIPDTNLYNADLSLENFKIEYHDSNKPEQCFIRIYGRGSDALVNNNGYCHFVGKFTFGFSGAISVLGELFSGNGFSVSGSTVTSDFAFDYPCNSDYYDLYISDLLPDISPIDNNYLLNLIIGDEVFFDFDNFALTVDRSSLEFDIYCMYDENDKSHFTGAKYSGYVDFLNPSHTTYTDYNVSADSGSDISDVEYVFNSKTQIQGYYYTQVSQDNYGNNTYTYYYTENNITTLLDSSGGSSGSSSSGNITFNCNHYEDDTPDLSIEDDDYSGASLYNAVKSFYGLRDDLDTATRDDGAFDLLFDFLDFLPGGFKELIGFGLSTTVAICLIYLILRR